MDSQVTYTRVSTAMQVDGYSLDAQREKLRRYAEFQNMQIAGEYTDEGKSGKNIEGRPEFCRMLEDIATGKLSGEKVYDFLTLYGIIYTEMTDAQKREFMHCFIKRVEVYPEKQPDGRILKSIEFNFPVWFGADFCASGLPAEKVTPETVCCLYHQKKDFISVPYEPKDASHLKQR